MVFVCLLFAVTWAPMKMYNISVSFHKDTVKIR